MWAVGYDLRDRRIAQTDPAGGIRTSVYNAAGESVAEVDPLGRRTTTVYDGAGRPIAVTDPLGHTTTTTYDAAGRVLTTTDPLGNTTTHTYDLAGNRLTTTDPLGHTTTWTYDSTNRPTVRSDARNKRTTSTYDVLSRETERVYDDGTRVTQTYDLAGNRLTLEDSTGTTTYTYDSLHRPSTVTTPEDRTITYSYDVASRRTLLIDPDGGRTTYSYDNNNRLTLHISPQGDRTTFTYDAAGREVGKVLANETRTSTTWDNAGRETQVLHLQSDNTTIAYFDYTYDLAHRRTKVETHDDVVTWTYDAADQLLSEESTGVADFHHTFTYDASGNRLTKDDGTEVTTYTYNGVNQLLTEEALAGTTSYTYDSAGNQLTVEEPSGDITTRTWDCENRIAEVELPTSDLVTLTYNGDGARVRKDDGTDELVFLWDGQNILQETDDTNTVEVEYALEPNQYGLLISQHRDTETSYYHFDAQGSTTALTDDTEVTTDTYTYEAFGKTQDSSGTTENPFRWVGQHGYYEDEELGAHHIRARNYSTRQSVWLSKDKVEDNHNKYSYNRNEPVQAIDPSGESDIFPRDGKNGFWLDVDTKKPITQAAVKENGGNGWWVRTTDVRGNGKIDPVKFVNGRPDFTPHQIGDAVTFEYQKTSKKDFAEMNRIAKYNKTPDKAVWHHVSHFVDKDGKSKGVAILVPKKYNNRVSHTGGRSDFENKLETPKEKIHATPNPSSAGEVTEVKAAKNKLTASGGDIKVDKKGRVKQIKLSPTDVFDIDSAGKVKRNTKVLLKGVGITAFTTVGVFGAIEQAKASTKALRVVGSKKNRERFRRAGEAIDRLDFSTAEKILFGDGESCESSTAGNPGIYCEVRDALRESAYLGADTFYSELKKKWRKATGKARLAIIKASKAYPQGNRIKSAWSGSCLT